jgi:hypothetical protein
MKNLILGLALCGLAFGCKTDKQAAISDASGAPSTECCASKSECSDAEKAECASKSECTDAQKAECASKKVCPMTGKELD